MAKLKVLPHEGIISGLKGKVDFYYWMGIPVVRRWPKSPGHRRAPAVEAQWPAFTIASQLWSDLSPEVQAAWNEMASGSGVSGRDLAAKAYLAGVYHYPH
ncbi:hypothetical protein ES705_35468 [subsurface metagenome]